jgi:hypothetical protein
MKIEISWTIHSTIYGSDLPFGEHGLTTIQESEIILYAYKKLDGSRFQPKIIRVNGWGVGAAMVDYLVDKSLPIEEFKIAPIQGHNLG